MTVSGSNAASYTTACPERSRRNALGRRFKKTIDGTTTQFLYDGLNPVQELNGSGGVVANMLTGLKVDEYFVRTEPSCCGPLRSDRRAGLDHRPGRQHRDHPVQLSTSPSARTAAPYNVNTTNTYQFTGRENDNLGFGMYFDRARYYSPAYQRFISQDPADFAGGDTNLYAYTLNSPTNLRDPSGKILSLLIAGGILGGGAAAYTNYGGYESGAISGEQYAEAIAFGAATGVLTAIPTGIIGSAIAGALGAGANSLFDQRLSHPCGGLSLSAAGESAALGGLGGFLAAGLGNLGDEVISINPSIGQEIPEPQFQSGYPTPGYTSYGTEGAIAGGAIGTAVGTLYSP